MKIMKKLEKKKNQAKDAIEGVTGGINTIKKLSKALKFKTSDSDRSESQGELVKKKK
jgi:hypothetical protein